MWNCVPYERKLLPYSLKYSGIWPFIEKMSSGEIMKKKQKANRVWLEPLGGGSNWPISVCLSDFTRTSRFLFSIDLRIFISKVFHTRSIRINRKRDSKPEIKTTDEQFFIDIIESSTGWLWRWLHYTLHSKTRRPKNGFQWQFEGCSTHYKSLSVSWIFRILYFLSYF